MSGRRALRQVPIASARVGVGLLSYGLHRDILAELDRHGPLTRLALTARVHSSPTRVYGGLKALRHAGAVSVDGRGRAPTYSATASGRELREVGLTVEGWFAAHPGGAVHPSVGWRAFSDLGEAWRLGLVEWIVRRVPTAGEIGGGGPAGVDPGRLAETLEAMVEAGILALRRAPDGRLRYRLTPWAARAVGLLALIARWELRHRPPGAAPIEVDDAIVAILATLPMVRVPDDVRGTFTFTAEADGRDARGRSSGTVWARLRHGHTMAIGEGAPPEPASGWAIGSFAGWLAAALDGRPRRLRLDGRDPDAIAGVDTVVAQLPVALGLSGG